MMDRTIRVGTIVRLKDGSVRTITRLHDTGMAWGVNSLEEPIRLDTIDRIQSQLEDRNKKGEAI